LGGRCLLVFDFGEGESSGRASRGEERATHLHLAWRAVHGGEAQARGGNRACRARYKRNRGIGISQRV
jgi:hypothetical protein